MENCNQKIAKWLGSCPHKNTKLNDIGIPDCLDCGEREIDYQPRAYDTDPIACLELIEAVRAKGYETWINNETGKYHVEICEVDSTVWLVENVWADTLPLAVAQAVLKLIEATEAK